MRYKWLAVLSLVSVACGSQPDSQALLAASQMASLSQTCHFTGTWGIRFEIPVSWPATVAVQAGRGTVYQWAKAQNAQQGNDLLGTLDVCGVAIPDNVAGDVFNHETYGITFPDSLFNGALPQSSLTMHLAGLSPGATFHTDSVTVLLGAALPHADTVPWPKAQALRAVDSDQDGLPGLTVLASIGPQYQAPPVNMFRTKRAGKFYIGLRNVVQSAAGVVNSCDNLSGTAVIPVFNNKAAINSHVLGCKRTDGVTCTRAEADLIDKQQSGYNLAGEATITMRRIDDQATCAMVRGML